MKKLLLLLLVGLIGCAKEKEVAPISTTGSIYFYNTYSINAIGSGVDILVDGVLVAHIRIRNNGSIECGNDQGFTYTGSVGKHTWRYVVSDTPFFAMNYGGQGESEITPDGCVKINMLK